MAAATKTAVATGASSGLGFEVVKQLLAQPSQPYTFILGVRDVPKAEAAYSALAFDRCLHHLTLLPLDLCSLVAVRNFAERTLSSLQKIDYLLLNAATSKPATAPGPNGSRWSESYIVNHLSQHYLTHLLRPKLESHTLTTTSSTHNNFHSHPQSRIIFVSSASFREVEQPTTEAINNAFDNDLLATSKTPGRKLYAETKFVNLLGAHWWRREFAAAATTSIVVVAVSPGLVPSTNIGRGMGVDFTMDWPGAREVGAGAASIIEAFTRDDFPDDPDRVFLTSWGEWWGRDVLDKTLDKELQDRWCPGKEEIERQEGLDV